MISLISHIFRRFFLQIVGLLIAVIVWSVLIVIFWWTVVGQYLWWIGWVVLIVVFALGLPLWSLRQIKSALIQSTGSYLVDNYQSDLTKRIVTHYTKHISNNTTVNSSINITKQLTASFPWIVRWWMRQMMHQIPMLTQIIDVVQDFNPLDLTHEQITQRLTERIDHTFASSEYTSTSLRSVYKWPILVVSIAGISIVWLHFYPIIVSLLW